MNGKNIYVISTHFGLNRTEVIRIVEAVCKEIDTHSEVVLMGDLNLLPDSEAGELKVLKGARNKFYGTVFKRPFMVQSKGKYKNYPWRTYSGNTFLGGYSDHFPVYIEIGK